jgi:hypothetical protein
MQRHSTINSAYTTQTDKIESLLRSRYGQWIPVYELSALALQYCARLNSIRKKLRAAGDLEEIPAPREQRVNGQLHNWYCIRRKDTSEPVKAESRHDRAKQFERKSRPGWHPRPFSEKRMAQDDCFVLTPPEPRP